MVNKIPTESMQPLSHLFAKDNAGKICHVITTTDIEHARAAMVAPALLASLKYYVAEHPAFRSKPYGAPNSDARRDQDKAIAFEDAAKAAIAKAEGVL